MMDSGETYASDGDFCGLRESKAIFLTRPEEKICESFCFA
jgi:hypothetical protein